MEGYSFYAKRPGETYHKSDMWFFVSVLLLWGLGIFTLFVCSQNYASRVFNGDSLHFVKRQLICSAVGFILFFILLLTDMKIIRKSIIFIVLISLLLCLLTFIPALSVEKNGARRWLKMPLSFSFQPSELIKFAMVLFLANYFDKQFKIENLEDRSVAPCVAGLLIFAGIVLMQKDFSTSSFILIIGILMFFVSGSKLRWIWPFLLLVIPLAVFIITTEPYRLARIIGFLKPDEYGSTFNYQANMAKKAISAGGFWGNGIGSGLIKINSIPEIQADYIFAGWSEAMGFVGVIIYIALLAFFAWRGYKAALNCPDRFAAYGAFGCVSIIFLQSLINCGVVCGLLPSTGIPLPFFSLGGSSIIMTLAMCGFILNASRCEESDDNIFKNDDTNIEMLTYL